jgi:hypothetical protein
MKATTRPALKRPLVTWEVTVRYPNDAPDHVRRWTVTTTWRIRRMEKAVRAQHPEASEWEIRLVSKVCGWFAGCGRTATGSTPHPVLGSVPTCDRCRAFATGEAKPEEEEGS